jgi:hypothetical protein
MSNQFLDSVGATVTNSPSEIPDWLTSPPTPIPVRTAEQEHTRSQLVQTQFESMFIRVLEEMASGKTLTQVLNEDFRGFKAGAFLKWVKRDPDRHSLYKEAKELRTEHWAAEVIEIADAEDAVEDVQRSRLRIDTRKWLMGSDNRKVYGETKTIDVGGSISIIGALEAANNRVVELSDVEDVTPRLTNEDN